MAKAKSVYQVMDINLETRIWWNKSSWVSTAGEGVEELKKGATNMRLFKTKKVALNHARKIDELGGRGVVVEVVPGAGNG